MIKAYRILAIIIAAEVVIQAMMIVFAVAGLGKYITDGGVVDKAAMEDEDLSSPAPPASWSTASTG